jgi:flagellar motor protein MotB
VSRLGLPALLCTAMALGACGAAPLRVAALDDMERVRGSADAQEGARLAPEAFARAEQERRIALEEHLAGDDLGASLHAHRSMAAYAHALVVGRLARATAEQADAQKTLDDATSQVQAIEAERAQLERDAAGLEERVRIARDRLLPAASATTTPEREQARLLAAGALALEARLLCHAARLTGTVAPDAPEVAEQEAELAKLDDRISRKARPAPIDDAARWRARCLGSLTKARRDAGDDASAADALLTELSAAGGWEPARDERGVVVTLHAPFLGSALTPAMASRLTDLGKVAAAHKGFALQIVIHDAQPSRPKDDTDSKRADTVTAALVTGGAATTAIHAEQAGTRAPLVDPRDGRERARNERLDVVFVSGHK